MSANTAKSTDTPSRRLWTYGETAEALKVSRRTVARLVALGELRKAMLGRCARIIASSVDDLISRSGTR